MVLKIINYLCSFYPSSASCSGQVDGFRNPMKNELQNKAGFETISNTNANFLKLYIDKARKTQHNTFYKINFKPKLFTAQVKCNGTVIELPKTDRVILFLSSNSRSMVATSSFGSLSTMLYTSDPKWH